MATVKEVQERKKKLKAEDPEAFSREIEAQRIAEEAAPDPVTQKVLDEARRAGINVFDPRNLKRLSGAEQAAQGARGDIAGQITGAGEQLEGFREDVATEEPQLPPVVEFAERLRSGAGELQDPVDAKPAILTNILNTNKQVNTFEAALQGLIEGLGFTADAIGSIPGVDQISFTRNVGEQEQIISDLRGVMSTLRGEVTDGTRSPEDAVRVLAVLEAKTNQAYTAAHIAGRFSLQARLNGLDKVETELMDSLEELNETRGIINRTIAQGVSQGLATPEQVLGELR